MSTFELPVSDCANFIVGKLDKSIFDDPTKPEFGVVVWYKTEDAAKAAAAAVIKAHWGAA